MEFYPLKKYAVQHMKNINGRDWRGDATVVEMVGIHPTKRKS
jgi:hypothetical protein